MRLTGLEKLLNQLFTDKTAYRVYFNDGWTHVYFNGNWKTFNALGEPCN